MKGDVTLFGLTITIELVLMVEEDAAKNKLLTLQPLRSWLFSRTG